MLRVNLNPWLKEQDDYYKEFRACLLCCLKKIAPIAPVAQCAGYAAWEPGGCPVVPISEHRCLLDWSRSFNSPGSHPDRHVLLLHQGLLFTKQGWLGIPLLSVLAFVFQWPLYEAFKIEAFKAGNRELRWGAAGEGADTVLCRLHQTPGSAGRQIFACFAARTCGVAKFLRAFRTLSTSGRSHFQVLDGDYGSMLLWTGWRGCMGGKSYFKEETGRRWPKWWSTRTIQGKNKMPEVGVFLKYNTWCVV